MLYAITDNLPAAERTIVWIVILVAGTAVGGAAWIEMPPILVGLIAAVGVYVGMATADGQAGSRNPEKPPYRAEDLEIDASKEDIDP